MVTFESVLWYAGIAAEIVVVALLVRSRTYKRFPVFSVYIAWGLLTDIVNSVVGYPYPAGYFWVYLAGMLIGSLFEFGVLVELTWSVLRPFRSALPRGAIVVIAFIIGGICAAIWPFASTSAMSHYGPQSRLLIHLQQTISIMRVLFFLVLAGFSQLLSISWRDRELQIATGLGFYSLVSVSVSIAQSGLKMGPLYYHLAEIGVVSYLCSLLYWTYSFATKEVERREFTPQMQNFLLAVAGAARGARISLTGHESDGVGKKDRR